jgi:hypothetical protein
VVDSNDRERATEAREELSKMVRSVQLFNILYFMVFAITFHFLHIEAIVKFQS